MQSRRFLSPVFALILVGCGSDPGFRGPFPSTEPDLGPVGEGRGVRVYSGTAAMLPDGPECTAEDAPGDRWCGFLALSSTGRRNIFVFNVTQVLAGVPVDCSENDPNCLLVATETIGCGTNWHWNYFAGDTLVYYDETLSPRIWRPGMDGGRLLVERPETGDMVFCAPAPNGTAASCLNLPDDQPDFNVIAAEMYVGALDSDNEPLLTEVDSNIIVGTFEDEGIQRFSYGFPGEGYVAWTTRETPGGPENLKLIHTGDLESFVFVKDDVHLWDTSADGSRWYWITTPNANGAGTLQTASFPDGADPTDLVGNVFDYRLESDDSLVVLTEYGDVVRVPNPLAAPEDLRPVDQGVIDILRHTERGRIAYAKNSDRGLTDLYLSKLDDAPSCLLNEAKTVPQSSIHFSPDGAATLWAVKKLIGYDAYYTRNADCHTELLTKNVDMLDWIGRETLLIVDAYDTTNDTGTLRFRKMHRDGTLDAGPPTVIADHVDSNAITGSTLLYTVNDSEGADGVYVRAFAR